MTRPTVPARVTEEEILVLRKHHIARCCDPDTQAVSEQHEHATERRRYWCALDERVAKRKTPDGRLYHAYTHDARGRKVRLG